MNFPCTDPCSKHQTKVSFGRLVICSASTCRSGNCYFFKYFQIFYSSVYLGKFLLFTQLLHFLCYVHLIMHIHIVFVLPLFTSRTTCSFTSHSTYLLLCCSLRNLWEGEWITIIHGSQNMFLMSICSLTIQCCYFGSKYSWRIHASIGSVFIRPQWLYLLSNL